MDLPSKLAKLAIERGTILHSTIFEDIDHGKFFAIVGINEYEVAGFFFINSNIHNSLYRKPEQFRMQYPLLQKNYSFLRYDSFLCATNIITRSRSELMESINKGTTEIIAYMTEEDLNNVLDMVRKSKLFSKIEKEQFFY